MNSINIAEYLYFINIVLLGDLQNEESVLEWLIDDDNRELADEIEEVNSRMLERLLDESLLLAVFFCNYKAITWLYVFVPSEIMV